MGSSVRCRNGKFNTVTMIAGVDGCKSGWVAAIDRGDGETFVQYFATFSDLASQPTLDLIVIDTPIGLSEPRNPRRADVEAKTFLGHRHVCVFHAPIRMLFRCPSQPEASKERQRLEEKGCSMQTFSIIPKVKSVDDCLATDLKLRTRVREGHPEVTFAVMNGNHPLAVSKHKKEGRQIRLTLLEEFFGDKPRHESDAEPSMREDIIDAYAMLWTARRAIRQDPDLKLLPRDGIPIDSAGLRMQIIA